jgi:hypothetical protein
MNHRRFFGPLLATLTSAAASIGCSDSAASGDEHSTMATSQALSPDACKVYCDTILESGYSKKFGGGCQNELAQCGISTSLPWGTTADCRRSCDEGYATTQLACLGSAPTAGTCLNCMLSAEDLVVMGIGSDYCGP